MNARLELTESENFNPKETHPPGLFRREREQFWSSIFQSVHRENESSSDQEKSIHRILKTNYLEAWNSVFGTLKNMTSFIFENGSQGSYDHIKRYETCAVVSSAEELLHHKHGSHIGGYLTKLLSNV